MSDIGAMKARVERLMDELEAARDELRTARCDATGFKVGDVVEAKSRKGDWAKAVIREIEPMSWSTWFKVSFANKGGEWSAAVREVFSEVRKIG